jgi:hypothetical protein
MLFCGVCANYYNSVFIPEFSSGTSLAALSSSPMSESFMLLNAMVGKPYALLRKQVCVRGVAPWT